MKEKTTSSPDAKQLLGQLDSFLTTYLINKAPAIPENIKEIIVKYGPYLSAIALFFSIPALLALFGLGAMLAPVGYLGGLRSGFSFSLVGVILLITLGLQLFALPGLFKRSMQGWNYLYYSTLINAVYSLVTMNLGSLILGTGLSLYILFQIKSYYK